MAVLGGVGCAAAGPGTRRDDKSPVLACFSPQASASDVHDTSNTVRTYSSVSSQARSRQLSSAPWGLAEIRPLLPMLIYCLTKIVSSLC